MKETGRSQRFQKLWERYKYVLLVALIGAALLLWPSRSDSAPSAGEESGASSVTLSQEDALLELESRMEEILGSIDGVGTLQLMLTADSSGERQLATDTELSYSGQTAAPDDYSRSSQTVIVSGGSGDEAVVVKCVSPTCRGALVVCQGADRAEVRLAVTQAVAALTGLSSDRITVVKCQ